MLKHMRISLRQINNTLLALIIIVNTYIIALPLWPSVDFWWRDHHTNTRSTLTETIRARTAPTAGQPHPNSLIIPAMLLNQPTLEGSEKDWFNILKNGIWRWPGSSTPDKGGNTVLLAHRFSYTGPRGAFYDLNKLQPGDKIGLIWNDKTYVYKVVSSAQVPPTDTSIEDNTPDSRLTLFTCTPLWHPVNRLVVVAKLENT
jgi:LPXTG-site transpeptidase (sortase) family protein